MKKHEIMLNPIPQWARAELLEDIQKKIQGEDLKIELPDLNTDSFQLGDLPYDLVIKGTAVVLAGIMPFIHDWLIKNRIHCEIRDDSNGNPTIVFSGYNPKKVLQVSKSFSEGLKKNDEHSN